MPKILLTIAAWSLVATVFADNHGRNSLVVVSLWSLLFALFWLVSRRVLWSLVIVAGLTAVTSTISYFKSAYMGFDLHAADFIYALPRADQMRFLVKSYWWQALSSLGLIAGFVWPAVTAWRNDEPTHVAFQWRLTALPALAVPMILFYPLTGSTGGYYLSRNHMSSLFVSLSDLPVMGRSTEIQDRIGRTPKTSGAQKNWHCNVVESELPDVVVVLQESQFRLGDEASLHILEQWKDQIAQREKPMVPLHVETAGGGTWITMFGLMTGLPAPVFGWARPYITMIMENQIEASLPGQFKTCNYSTTALLAGKSTFAGEGEFMLSIGFDQVVDLPYSPRNTDHFDDFYFSRAFDFLAAKNDSARPSFVFMETMAMHSPYDGWNGDEEQPFVTAPQKQENWNSYVKRLMKSRSDFEAFLEKLRTLKRPRGLLVLEFGDHRPNLVLASPSAPEKVADWRSDIYQTYYQFHEIGFRSRDSSDGPIDVGFLGTRLLDKIGLVGDSSFERLRKLRDECGGAYYTCAKQTAVNRHLKWLSDSGLVKFP